MVSACRTQSYWELLQPGKGMNSEESLCSTSLDIFSTILKCFVLLKVLSEQYQNLIQITEALCRHVKSFLLSQPLFLPCCKVQGCFVHWMLQISVGRLLGITQGIKFQGIEELAQL